MPGAWHEWHCTFWFLGVSGILKVNASRWVAPFCFRRLVYFDKHLGRLRKVSQGKVQNRYQPRQGSCAFTKKWKLPLGNLRNLPACAVPFVPGT